MLPNVLPKYASKCASKMCFQKVLPKCASKMCFQNVLPKCASKTCFQNMLPKRASKTCFQNVLSRHREPLINSWASKNTSIISKNQMVKAFSYQNVFLEVLPKQAPRSWMSWMPLLFGETVNSELARPVWVGIGWYASTIRWNHNPTELAPQHGLTCVVPASKYV